MSDQFVGEIRMFAGTFAPQGWLTCDGQLLPISGNEVLYTLIGTTYGGDGNSTFGLPDLRGRVPMAQGTGQGLSSRVLGQSFGSEQMTLTNQTAGHTHPLQAAPVLGALTVPTNNALAGIPTANGTLFNSAAANPVTLAPASVSAVGGSQPHENRMPILCVTFIIALSGLYPSQG